MDDTERGLLRAIIETPDDDLVRLVYADWLEEHARQQRATFIRDQIALAQLVLADAYDSDEYVQTLARVHAIPNRVFASHLRHLQFPLQPPVMVDIVGDWVIARDQDNLRCGYHRGFVQTISLPLLQRLPLQPLIADLCPLAEITLNQVMQVRFPAPTTLKLIVTSGRIRAQYEKSWPTRPELWVGLQSWIPSCIRDSLRDGPTLPPLNPRHLTPEMVDRVRLLAPLPPR